MLELLQVLGKTNSAAITVTLPITAALENESLDEERYQIVLSYSIISFLSSHLNAKPKHTKYAGEYTALISTSFPGPLPWLGGGPTPKPR